MSANSKLKSYTPAESRALEDHYIARAKELGFKRPNLEAMTSQAKRENILKSERCQAAQRRKQKVLDRLKQSEATLADLVADLGDDIHKTTYVLRNLVKEGRAVCVRKPAGSIPALYRAAEGES